MIPILIEMRINDKWQVDRIIRDLSSVRIALDTLPVLAMQLKTNIENLRVKVLRSAQALVNAEGIIVEQVRQQMIDEGTSYE